MNMQAVFKHIWSIGLMLAILLGIVFRTIWLNDVEYKFDEQWTFEATQQFRETGQIPFFGMGSSAGIPNAGLSVWVFLVLSKLFFVTDPPALARAVQITNIVAILVLLLFVLRCVDRSEQEPWLWSIALVSVNPLAVLFQRKIWPPSVFPIFTMALLLGWWHRRLRWGALLWGLVGVGLGQIQLGGFFFAAGFVLWALLFDRRSVRWLYWLLGSALGAIPLIPWLVALLQSDGPSRQPDLGLLLQLPFYQHWFSLSLGLNLNYSLGDNYLEFLAQPIIAGRSLYLVTALHVAIVSLFAFMLLRLVRQLFKAPAAVRIDLPGRSSPSTFAISSAFWGYGGLLTLSLVPIYLHYLIILFNLPYLAVAWIAGFPSQFNAHAQTTSRRLLTALCLCQVLLTLSFLGFIHEKQVIQGDYGTTYRTQQQLEYQVPSN